MSDIRWQNCYQRYERPGNAALAIMRDITYNIPHRKNCNSLARSFPMAELLKNR